MKKKRSLRLKWLPWNAWFSVFYGNARAIFCRLMVNVIDGYREHCLYVRCGELPLERFIRCMCEGDMPALRRCGMVRKCVLKRTWVKILEEYAKLSGDAGYEKSFLLSKEIARENVRFLLVKSCLKVLGVRYSRKCVDYLRTQGYVYPFDKDDPAAYRKDWEQVNKKARMIGVELVNKRKLYERSFSEAGKLPPREGFIRALASLSKYMGFRIDPEKVTVEEYVVMQKQYEKEVLALAGNKGRKGYNK